MSKALVINCFALVIFAYQFFVLTNVPTREVNDAQLGKMKGEWTYLRKDCSGKSV